MRQYVYISERKLHALDVPQRHRFFSRLRKVDVTAGPVGAGAELAESDAPTLIARITAADQAIRDASSVRNVTDPALAAGHWFASDGLEMAYGVQQAGEQRGAAIFAAEWPGVRLLLSGSARFLLDREPPIDDAGSSMSAPQTIGQMLASLTEDAVPTELDAKSMDAHAAANIYQAFARFGLQPMSFLARAIKVGTSRWGPTATLILGTPLFVAFAEPA